MFYDVFINKLTEKFIVIEEDFEKEESLQDLGYYLLSANARSIAQGKKMMQHNYTDFTELRLEPIPMTLKASKEFINQYHRHHQAPQGHKFSFGLSDGLNIVGVVVAGRPVSRFNDDGETLEVTRLCVLAGFKNGCSKLYSSVAKIAKIMGYKKIITYVLDSEVGTSLRASGWTLEKITNGGSWNSPSRPRVDKSPICKKQRWSRKLGMNPHRLL